MATTKVSELAELTSTDGAEQLLVNDGGTSKRLLISNLPVGSLGDSDQYVDGSIDNVHLADNAVGTDEIADDAVTADKLANAINTAIAANTAKTTNATHSGDVTGATSLTIAVDAVDIAMLSATGSAGSSTFLRGDNSWVTPTDTNTTYSVQDGELSQINFTSADHTKLNAIEASADVTDTTNVTAAGALMDSELAGIAAVKATTGTFLSADESKLDAVEASADVTDATNVASAGAGMLTVDQSWSGSQRGTPSTVTDGTLDLDTANNFKYTPASSPDTLEFTNEEAGQSGFITLINPSGHTIALGSEVDKGSSWDVSTAGTYLISYYTDGTNVYVSASEALS